MKGSVFPRLVLAALAWTATAQAQMSPMGGGMGGMGMGGMGSPMGGGMGGPSGGKQKKQAKPDKDPNAPETHAASGEDSILPEGNEPSLPEEPNKISEEHAAQIGSDGDPDTLGTQDSKRDFYGLYYNEQAGEYRYRVLFPLWAERTMPSAKAPEQVDRASVYGGVYYNRRGAENRDDILFPIFWNLRNPLENTRTTIVGPFVNRRTPTETDDWLAPVYMTGTRKDGGYTIIPPLLTGITKNAEGGFSVVGPYYCSYTGGQDCDTRTAQSLYTGVVPFWFFSQDKDHLQEVIPPLLHYYRYTERTGGYTNIYGPYYREHTEKRELLHILPFSWNIWGENERHTTVLPFFHHGYSGNAHLTVTPFFLNAKSEEGDTTFVSWLYAHHKGRTELEMISPLYWSYRDPDIGLERKVFLPFLYTNTSPREQTSAFVPFWAYTERYGVGHSLWVTPFFHTSKDLSGYSTQILPFFSIGRDGNSSHTILAPFFFDFATPRNRTTIGLPLFLRHSSLDSVTQLTGNFLYLERRYKNGRDWSVHLLPVLSYGETPDGHFWNFLFGFTGYTRKGTASTMRLLWIPIPLSE